MLALHVCNNIMSFPQKLTSNSTYVKGFMVCACPTYIIEAKHEAIYQLMVYQQLPVDGVPTIPSFIG